MTTVRPLTSGKVSQFAFDFSIYTLYEQWAIIRELVATMTLHQLPPQSCNTGNELLHLYAAAVRLGGSVLTPASVIASGVNSTARQSEQISRIDVSVIILNCTQSHIRVHTEQLHVHTSTCYGDVPRRFPGATSRQTIDS